MNMNTINTFDIIKKNQSKINPLVQKIEYESYKVNSVISRNAKFHINKKDSPYNQIMNDCNKEETIDNSLETLENKPESIEYEKFILNKKFKKLILDIKNPEYSGSPENLDQMIHKLSNELNDIENKIKNVKKYTYIMEYDLKEFNLSDEDKRIIKLINDSLDNFNDDELSFF